MRKTFTAEFKAKVIYPWKPGKIINQSNRQKKLCPRAKREFGAQKIDRLSKPSSMPFRLLCGDLRR
ncbi:hypothetical protein FACS1894108_05910 [Planctomycetales bacterium]|nr:hypothetical protein FACS1894108_05910 [Planctomycetales bacterium]